MTIQRKFYIFILFITITLFKPSFADIDYQRVIAPEKAFLVVTSYVDSNLEIDIAIKPGYYLYQSKFIFSSKPKQILGTPGYSESITHSDEFFGQQQIFRDNVHISLPVRAKTANMVFNFNLSLQGCADVGICYPPIEKHYQIKDNLLISLDKEQNNFIKDKQTLIQNIAKKTNHSSTVTDKFNFIPTEYNATASGPNISWQSLLSTLLFFLLAGLAMSLTACAYPLVPIVSSIIVTQQGKGKSFWPTLIYTQGIAFIYTLLGIIAGFSGVLLSTYMQQSIFIIPASILIFLLGLSMLDIFQLQLPNYWQNALNNAQINSKNKNIRLFLMGCISALVIGPCIAPPLAFALGYISNTHDVLLGALSLYTMGLGLSIPLLIFSILGDRFLPKAGNWMNVIKYLMGVSLLFIAIYLASPFLPTILSLILYSIVLLLPLYIFYKNPSQNLLVKLCYLSVSLLGTFMTGYLLSNHYLQKSNKLNIFLSIAPKNNTTNTLLARKYTDVQRLVKDIQTTLKNNPQEPVYLDFYADWCTSCKEMEKYTFSDPKVKRVLNQNNFFQIDITENTQAQRALLKMFNMYAPPGFFIIKAPNIYSKPLLGFEKPDTFLQWIEKNKHQF